MWNQAGAIGNPANYRNMAASVNPPAFRPFGSDTGALSTTSPRLAGLAQFSLNGQFPAMHPGRSAAVSGSFDVYVIGAFSVPETSHYSVRLTMSHPQPTSHLPASIVIVHSAQLFTLAVLESFRLQTLFCGTSTTILKPRTAWFSRSMLEAHFCSPRRALWRSQTTSTCRLVCSLQATRSTWLLDPAQRTQVIPSSWISPSVKVCACPCPSHVSIVVSPLHY
jgi:hypothetical protein